MRKDLILVAGKNHIFSTQVLSNNEGVTGQTVKFVIKRLSDNTYWTGAAWGVATDLSCSETDSTNFPGEYTYTLAGTQIQDGVEYITQFKITSGIYAFNFVERFVGEYDLQKLALTYNFTTYSKAVILWYDMDAPLSGDPVYWAYVYNSVGGNPSTAAQITTKDRTIRWTTAQPA